MPALDAAAAWTALAPFPLPRFAQAGLCRLLALDQVEAVYAGLRRAADPRPFTGRLLEALEIDASVTPRDLDAIPRSGATVVVANHPFGLLEGALLANVLSRIRPDVRILANGALLMLPELHDQLVAVDPMGGSAATRANPRGLRQALDLLAAGGLLVIFPAGEVSHYQWRRRAVEDSEWKPSIARLLRALRRRQPEFSIVPAFIDGQNSVLFHAAGLVHPRLRTALLARELFNKRQARVSLRFGRPIPGGKLEELASDEDRMAYLRWRTYLLSGRGRSSAPPPRALAPVNPPLDPALLAHDIAALGEPLVRSGSLEVHLARAACLPAVLPEIARLREITFRAAGEGTGEREDRDAFDETYWHLFVWNAEKREIAGAYRLAGTDTTRELYTRTLFQYGPELLEKLGPALELGRSFVRAEYQRSFSALLLLWKGIGEFIGRNPRYRVLFGPVSISGQYRAVSRELMVAWLEKHAWFQELAGLVSSRNPLRRQTIDHVPANVRDFDEVNELVSDLEPAAAGVPVLLRQYLKLGGRLLGFNVDPGFAHALDGLIVVDLLATEPRLLQRYLGPESAARLRAHHSQERTIS